MTDEPQPWPVAGVSKPVEKIDTPTSYLHEARRHINVARDNLKELNNLYAQKGESNPYQEHLVVAVKLARDLEDAYVRSNKPELYGPETIGDEVSRGEDS